MLRMEYVSILFIALQGNLQNTSVTCRENFVVIHKLTCKVQAVHSLL